MKRVTIFRLGAFFVVAAICCPLVHACLWDRDTLKDETTLKPDVFDLITGQFPHHGDGYYRVRIERLEGNLDVQPDPYLARNDLAVANIRLKNFDTAEALLRVNLTQRSEDYFTMSNLGVLSKKRGDYDEAAKWIEKALGIRPEGHLGLGDWYLKMLRYRAAFKYSDKAPANNFLGEAYAESFRASNVPVWDRPVEERPVLRPERLEKLKLLVQNDQTFADGFVVLGDELANGGDLNLAFLAFTRALEIGHPNDAEIRRRRRKLLQFFHEAESREYRDIRAYWRMKISAAESQLRAAAKWLPQFQKVESELAQGTAAGGNLPGFEKVMKEMESQKNFKYRPES